MTPTTDLLVAHIAQPSSAPSSFSRALEKLSAQVLHFGDPCESLKRLPLHSGVVFLVERSALSGGGMMWLILLAEAHRGPVVLIEEDRDQDPSAALRAGVQSVVYAPDFQEATAIDALVADAFRNFERRSRTGTTWSGRTLRGAPRDSAGQASATGGPADLRAFLRDSLNEFRTPLTAIVEFASILEDGIAGPLNPKQSEYADHILNACEDLLELFGDFRQSADLRLGREGEDAAPLGLLDLIDEALLQVRTTRVTFRVDCDDESLRVRAGRDALVTAVARIAQRAAKCSRRGSEVLVRVRCVAGVRAEVAVIDQGPAAAAGDIELLAEGVRCRGPHTKSVTQVFGVGMELASALLADQGIRLEMGVAKEGGSQLSFSLPIAAAA